LPREESGSMRRRVPFGDCLAPFRKTRTCCGGRPARPGRSRDSRTRRTGSTPGAAGCRGLPGLAECVAMGGPRREAATVRAGFARSGTGPTGAAREPRGHRPLARADLERSRPSPRPNTSGAAQAGAVTALPRRAPRPARTRTKAPPRAPARTPSDRRATPPGRLTVARPSPSRGPRCWGPEVRFEESAAQRGRDPWPCLPPRRRRAAALPDAQDHFAELRVPST